MVYSGEISKQKSGSALWTRRPLPSGFAIIAKSKRDRISRCLLAKQPSRGPAREDMSFADLESDESPS
jgi:hypothetical protein